MDNDFGAVYAPWQATGEVDMAPVCGGWEGIWQPHPQSGSNSAWLELTFSVPVWATTIEIYEVLNAHRHC